MEKLDVVSAHCSMLSLSLSSLSVYYHKTTLCDSSGTLVSSDSPSRMLSLTSLLCTFKVQWWSFGLMHILLYAGPTWRKNCRECKGEKSARMKPHCYVLDMSHMHELLYITNNPLNVLCSIIGIDHSCTYVFLVSPATRPCSYVQQYGNGLSYILVTQDCQTYLAKTAYTYMASCTVTVSWWPYTAAFTCSSILT